MVKAHMMAQGVIVKEGQIWECKYLPSKPILVEIVAIGRKYIYGCIEANDWEGIMEDGDLLRLVKEAS